MLPTARTPQDVAQDEDLSDRDLDALRENLMLTPAQRIAELVEMNRFHADVQSRTLSPALRAALDEREREEERQRLLERGE